jgi:hypothetical protein
MGITSLPSVNTGASPIVSPRDDLNAKRVALEVAEHGYQVSVALNWERLEAALTDMPARVVMAMISVNASRSGRV